MKDFVDFLFDNESILIKMTDDWLEAMDQGLYTGAIFLDLRKAGES